MMDTLDERVVAARHFDQIHQLAFHLPVLLAQHLDLALDQRHRMPRGVRHLELGEHLDVAFEEIRMPDQIIGDGIFLLGVIRQAGLVLDAHRSMVPSYTRCAGPRIQMGWPSPCQLITSRPPRRATSTVSSSQPASRPQAVVAQAPEPHAKVSPVPRSNTRSFTCVRSNHCAKFTLTRFGKRACRSIFGPSSATGAMSTSGTSRIACGLPTEIAPIS